MEAEKWKFYNRYRVSVSQGGKRSTRMDGWMDGSDGCEIILMNLIPMNSTPEGSQDHKLYTVLF